MHQCHLDKIWSCACSVLLKALYPKTCVVHFYPDRMHVYVLAWLSLPFSATHIHCNPPAAQVVLRALKELHARGFVHRDIRWENIMHTAQVGEMCRLWWAEWFSFGYQGLLSSGNGHLPQP